MIPNGGFTPRKPLNTPRRAARWSLWNLRAAGVVYLLAVEAVTSLVVTAVLVRGTDADTTTWLRLGVLVTLLAVYGELADRVERLLIWLHTDRGAWVGQGSILLFAGVLTLPTWAALAQCLIAFLHFGFRNRRYATAPAHRWVWTATTVALGTLASSVVLHALGGTADRIGPLDLLVIALTAAVYSAGQLLVLLTGMYLAVRPGTIRSLAPDRAQISYEAAKLLLGLVGCVLLVHSILLTPAVLVFGALLQRSILVGELRTVASTDAKTGLLTYRAWVEQAAAALVSCERAGRPGALVLLDIDHFKRVNDTFGHAAGDRTLAAIGAVLSAEVRAQDCVGRYGGEEFVVFLPGVDAAHAVEIAQRLRENIADRTAGVPDGAGVTASIGVANLGMNGRSLEQLLDAADAAMYRAKNRGRNTVCTAVAA